MLKRQEIECEQAAPLFESFRSSVLWALEGSLLFLDLESKLRETVIFCFLFFYFSDWFRELSPDSVQNHRRRSVCFLYLVSLGASLFSFTVRLSGGL